MPKLRKKHSATFEPHFFTKFYGSVRYKILVESGTSQKTTEEERNKDQHMCQALLDVVSAHIRKPNINHTLNRTFGPVLEKLRPGLFVENLLIE